MSFPKKIHINTQTKISIGDKKNAKMDNNKNNKRLIIKYIFSL